MHTTRNAGLILILIALSTFSGIAQPASREHASSDQIVACINQNLGVRTLVYRDFLGAFSHIRCVPGQSKSVMMQNIEQEHFRILSNSKWAFLVPEDVLSGPGRAVKVEWKSLEVSVDIVPSQDGDAPRPLSQDVSLLEQQLLAHSRLIPVEATGDSEKPNIAQVNLRYEVQEVRQPSGVQKIVALLREGDEFDSMARIIVATANGTSPTIEWDSPLLYVNAHQPGISLNDVDNDGTPEIVARATVGFGAHGPGWDTITIFSLDGQELTRQDDCNWMDRTEFESGPGRVCPIPGREVSLDTGEQALIRASQTPGDGNTVFVLKDRRFVPVRKQIKKLYHKPVGSK
jgi:hypothetical protein